MAGPRTSFESYRKAFNHGKKKTAENVHRARNRVTRPDIAESLPQLEEKYKRWKKDIAYLKEIDAYDLSGQHDDLDPARLHAGRSPQGVDEQTRNNRTESEHLEIHPH